MGVMGHPSQLILVVEDNRHQQLIYRYVLKTGLSRHAIRIQKSPSASGSASTWVRIQFVKEVRVYRSRYPQTKLIIVIDADAHTVRQRLSQLDQALHEVGDIPVDTDKERIARLVPKRNVETWILCLLGENVDEREDYKRTRHDWGSLIARAAEDLYRWTRPNTELPTNCIDSLAHGVLELRKLDA